MNLIIILSFMSMAHLYSNEVIRKLSKGLLKFNKQVLSQKELSFVSKRIEAQFFVLEKEMIKLQLTTFQKAKRTDSNILKINYQAYQNHPLKINSEEERALWARLILKNEVQLMNLKEIHNWPDGTYLYVLDEDLKFHIIPRFVKSRVEAGKEQFNRIVPMGHIDLAENIDKELVSAGEIVIRYHQIFEVNNRSGYLRGNSDTLKLVEKLLYFEENIEKIPLVDYSVSLIPSGHFNIQYDLESHLWLEAGYSGLSKEAQDFKVAVIETQKLMTAFFQKNQTPEKTIEDLKLKLEQLIEKHALDSRFSYVCGLVNMLLVPYEDPLSIIRVYFYKSFKNNLHQYLEIIRYAQEILLKK